MQTVEHLDVPKEHWKALNEIDAVGIYCSLNILYLLLLRFKLFCVEIKSAYEL